MCIHSFDGKSIQMELVSEIAWNTFAQHSQQNQSSAPLWTSSARITALETTFNGWENARILFELVILWYNCGRQTKFNDKLSYARVFFLVFTYDIHRQKYWTRWRPRLRISSIMASKDLRPIPKIYLQVFFSFSFHQIEDLRCSNCISHGTKHSSLQIEPWSPPYWILLIFYCSGV